MGIFRLAPDDLGSLFAGSDRKTELSVGEWTRHHPKSFARFLEERRSSKLCEFGSRHFQEKTLSAEKFVPQLGTDFSM